MKRDPVQYIDFSDYLKIITKRDNWKNSFNRIFKDEDIITAKLKELEPIRNAARHSRKLTSEQKEKLKVLSKDIVRQISAMAPLDKWVS
jgi:ArsR family metal-binding transcriptional regulator